MTIVNASEFVKTHIRRTWEAPEDASEHAVAMEAVEALFAVAEGWLDIAALEARIGLYDRGTFTEADIRPPHPFQLLRLQPAGDVRVKPMYRPLETPASVLNAATAAAWLTAKLSEAQGPEARYEPSLRELQVAGSRARLPDDAASGELRVSCYAGEITVPVDRGWVTAPTSPPGVPNPISLRLTNDDGALRLAVDVFWSLWASEPVPVPPIREGLMRLEARGWREDG